MIVNPTHVAVALRYRHGEMDAPVLVAKGTGAAAAGIRRIAARFSVPVVQNVSLARALHAQTDVDRAVPQTLFADVARLMVWVLAMRGASGGSVEPGGRSA